MNLKMNVPNDLIASEYTSAILESLLKKEKLDLIRNLRKMLFRAL